MSDVRITDGEAILISRIGKMMYALDNIRKGIAELDDWRASWGYQIDDEVDIALRDARYLLKCQIEDVINHRRVNAPTATPLKVPDTKDDTHEPDDLSL